MKHIRFLKSQKTICMHPEMLGEDFVTVDYEPFDGPSCHECYQLLITHNDRENKIEQAWADIVRNYNSYQEDDPLSAARGIMLGITLSSGFWIGIFIIGWLLGWWF